MSLTSVLPSQICHFSDLFVVKTKADFHPQLLITFPITLNELQLTFFFKGVSGITLEYFL